LAYRNEPHDKVLETTLVKFESAKTRGKNSKTEGRVGVRVVGLHKSLSMIDRRDYVVPRRREKKPTARIWPRYSSMPKTCVTTKLRDVANKGKDTNEHMKQRTGGMNGKAGLRRTKRRAVRRTHTGMTSTWRQIFVHICLQVATIEARGRGCRSVTRTGKRPGTYEMVSVDVA